MTFQVRYSPAALADFERLYNFLLARAESVEALERAAQVIDGIRETATGQLARSPYSFRKAGADPLTRELIIPSGSSGYVALFQIEPPSTVLVLAIRHQREEDYH